MIHWIKNFLARWNSVIYRPNPQGLKMISCSKWWLDHYTERAKEYRDYGGFDHMADEIERFAREERVHLNELEKCYGIRSSNNRKGD